MADHDPNLTKADSASPSTTTTAPAVHVHHAEIPEEHPERHERTDVSVRGIWITVGAVFLVTIIVHVIMYVVFFAYEGAQAKQDEAERRSAIESEAAVPSPDVPRLQGIDGYNPMTPAEELVKVRAENKAIVDSYGTIDGRKHIPIDRAMQIALEHQQQVFPSRAPATQPATSGGAHAAR